MKTVLFLALAGAVLLTAGCVGTVTGGRTLGVPFVKDKLEDRYKMSPDVIFAAAKDVIRADGVLTKEGVNYSTTNEMKVVQGRVSECTVWVSVAPVDAQVTSVIVQTRTPNGGSNMNLAHQIQVEIAVKLAAR